MSLHNIGCSPFDNQFNMMAGVCNFVSDKAEKKLINILTKFTPEVKLIFRCLGTKNCYKKSKAIILV